jgi:hypothetical protein
MIVHAQLNTVYRSFEKVMLKCKAKLNNLTQRLLSSFKKV